MRRFRLALFALGLTLAVVGLGATVLTREHVDERHRSLELAGTAGVKRLENVTEQAAAAALLTARNTAFADFYAAPGGREEKIRQGGPLMDRVNAGLRYLAELYPDWISEACFIDRSGAENAQVTDGRVTDWSDLDTGEQDEPFFAPGFRQQYGHVYQSPPHVSDYTGDWVVTSVAKVDAGPGVAPAIIHFEVRIEGFRQALIPDSLWVVQVVDRRTGRIVLDSRMPQDTGAPLGPGGRLPVAALRNDGLVSHVHGRDTYVGIPEFAPGNANDWALVVSTSGRDGLLIADPPLLAYGLLLAGLVLLILAAIGQRAHWRGVRRAAREDPLTGLANRAEARRLAERMLSRGTLGAVALLDLDRFKIINDTMGHATGDELLIAVAARIREALREDADLVARLGGDEFIVLMPASGGGWSADAVCGRLMRAVTEPVEIAGLSVTVGVSIGVALAPMHGKDFGTLLRCADIAMYDAKKLQLGWEVYRPELAERDALDLALDSDLRRGIAAGELELHYQGCFTAVTQSLSRVEALVRWRHPHRGLMPPGEFVPVAERSGAIRAVTRCVIRQALADLSVWRVLNPDLQVAVNVSARDLSDPEFPRLVQRALHETGLPGGALVVEVTETTLLVDADQAVRSLERLTAAGVQVAIDDFGAGYASLLYLRRFPASLLKLDRSLVAGAAENEGDRAIVRWTVQLAHSMGLRVLAEGVESAALQEVVIALGCDELQGFHLHRPAPADELGGLEELASYPVSSG